MKSYTKEQANNFGRYRKNLNGAWFAASLPQMEDWAKDQTDLIPLADIVPNKAIAAGWYVPAATKISDLTKYFSFWAINQFGIFELNYNFQI